MNEDKSFSSLSRATKREKLMALIERRKVGKRSMLKKLDNTNSKKRVEDSVKRKKVNSHFRKKLFQTGKQNVKRLNHVYDMIPKKSRSCSRRKKRRLCHEETHNHVLPYVSKLRDYWNRGQNAVIFDGQDRLVKVVSFVLSLLDNIKKPILILASSSALSLWKLEFSKRSKSVNVVTYNGNKDIRAAIKDLEFQVLLSSPDAIVEDIEIVDRIKWALLVIEECQRHIFSTHLKKLQMVTADMKLLTVSGESVDICESYQNFLSFLDCKYENINTDADVETNDININTLKERLSPFIAFECKLTTPGFQEYWVPVHLSSMQIEQYCSILASNFEALSSYSKNSSFHNIITQIRKCCDHPYLVDPTLRNSSNDASLIDPLDAEVNVSGKLQLLDKLLLEIKRSGLRALVLFQSTVNSEKISTGHLLDDLVHQRFGQDSYVYIPGKILSKSIRAKKKESLKMFNKEASDSFICLCDYRACHSSVRLSRVDVVILFNSDPNPSNDIKALKRVTIDSPRERLNILRLYSSFTVEEKALILSKQGTTVNYTSSSVCHQLLTWGASYLFSKLQSCTDSWPLSFIDDLVCKLSSLLRNTGVQTGPTGPTNRSIISNAEMQNGAYSGSIMLFGETEAHMKESCSVDEYLSDDSPSVFWSNVVKQSQHGPKNSCSRLSQRVQKSPSFVRKKPRSKRRKRAAKCMPFDSQQSCENVIDGCRSGSQQSQTDQTSSSTPLEAEIERILKEREQITKTHQEKKSMLLAEREKEISEVHKKYDALIRDSDMSLTKEIKNLDDYHKLVNAHKLLAEILAQKFEDTQNVKRSKKETSSVKILQVPASALMRRENPHWTSGPATNLAGSGHSLVGSGLRAPPPHLRSNPSMFASFHHQPTTNGTGETSLESFIAHFVNYPNS
ncbi:putative DNA helicase chromatin remodeling SNF2 family [Helianthus annuus]|uniref:chromodomain-helicase-DNA-binding protein 3 n=1 Tax=Helianthus annuus TaxID=4232 RepID=UPI000B90166C|nr:chromodomain-helicase-DNA-binding protein 3 [Helianthus annuus]KAJ0477811.1 putative DNA helicase chromatin remodeling SNF2 family [Helianthus annuus]KAJ0482394.1 putative DNA helicase chromatin remodeling SNF2 family [Helianthus annuus]KAJ0664657.1 putative DNA helicase chromatin remodeling SNF2 family [Helianthus annuus]KAJ0859339.1 putative DNA helicase chromatin remodeling SNF2 family [Helianthus annuus]